MDLILEKYQEEPNMKAIKSEYLWIKEILNNKFSYLIFLLILIGTFIGGYSINQSNNFYANVLDIMHNDYFLLCIFITCIINVYNFCFYLLDNISYLIRQKNFNALILNINKKIFLSNLIIFLIIILLLITTSIFFCYGSFSLIIDFKTLVYIIWDIIKLYLFFSIISNIFIYLYILFNEKNFILISVLFIIFLFLALILKPYLIVSDFSKFPLIFVWCLSYIEYYSFSLDLFSFSIHFVILTIIYLFLFEYVRKKEKINYEV